MEIHLKILGYLLTASGIGAIIASLLMTSQNAKLETIINKILLSSMLAIFSLFVLVNTPLFWLGIISIYSKSWVFILSMLVWTL